MNDEIMLTQILPAAKFAVVCASRLAASVQAAVLASAGDKLAKADTSPVTIGDFGAQAIVSLLLQHHTRHVDGFRFRLLAEEESSTFTSGGDALQSHVLNAVNDTLAWARNPIEQTGSRSEISAADVATLIDAGRVEDADAGTVGRENGYFILDPIDGTKGFLRQGQWAVGLAYLLAGSPVLSVIACPNLPYYDAAAGALAAAAGAGEGASGAPALAPGQRGSLFTAVAGLGAYVEPLPDLLASTAADLPALPACAYPKAGVASALASGDAASAAGEGAFWRRGSQRIQVSAARAGPSTLYAESFERGHSDRSATSVVAAAAGISREPLRCDSMVKYCMVARGQADLFMRFMPGSYREKVWDHAPGWLLVREAGGLVTDATGGPLDFAQGRIMPAHAGILAANPALHAEILAAVARSGVTDEKPGPASATASEPAGSAAKALG